MGKNIFPYTRWSQISRIGKSLCLLKNIFCYRENQLQMHPSIYLQVPLVSLLQELSSSICIFRIAELFWQLLIWGNRSFWPRIPSFRAEVSLIVFAASHQIVFLSNSEPTRPSLHTMVGLSTMCGSGGLGRLVFCACRPYQLKARTN